MFRGFRSSDWLTVASTAIQVIAFILLEVIWIVRIDPRGTGFNTCSPIYRPYTWYFLSPIHI